MTVVTKVIMAFWQNINKSHLLFDILNCRVQVHSRYLYISSLGMPLWSCSDVWNVPFYEWYIVQKVYIIFNLIFFLFLVGMGVVGGWGVTDVCHDNLYMLACLLSAVYLPYKCRPCLK